MFGGFDYGVILPWAPLLMQGMGVSLVLTGAAITTGILVGAVLAAMRLSSRPILYIAAGFYVNFFRSIPLILVIFWIYFGLPILTGHPVGSFYSALISFTIFEAAYFCEIIRAGIMSVPRGQTFAGSAIGLTHLQCMAHIILPQALRNMAPVLVTRAIVMFQDTSLVYVIGLRDFLTAADIVATRENRLTEIYLFVAATYFIICFGGSSVARLLQWRVAQ